MNRLNQIYLGLFLAAFGTVQCSVFEPPITDGGAVGGGDGGPIEAEGPWWIETNEYGCETVRTPTKADDRPDAAFEDESVAPIYLAMSRVINGAANNDETLTENLEAWRDIGFDRDGRCTSSPSCMVNGDRVDEPSCVSGIGTPSEGNRCIDNSMGYLFSLAAQVKIPGSPVEYLDMTDPDWNCELHRGGFSTILKISDYNGSENDPVVRLDMYVSTGLQRLPPWSCRENIASPLSADWYQYPSWMPSEHWKIARRSISLSAEPAGNEVPDSNTFDATAFVRSGYLFAELPEGREFAFAGDHTPIPGFRNIMHKPILLAKLSYNPDNKGWMMEEGVLSYFVLPDEFMRSYRELGLCENMCGSLDLIKSYVNTAQDVLLSGESLPDAPCTALSLAVAFDARQATATIDDVEDIDEVEDCPQPRHPDAPRIGCVCQDDGTCILPDDGI